MILPLVVVALLATGTPAAHAQTSDVDLELAVFGSNNPGTRGIAVERATASGSFRFALVEGVVTCEAPGEVFVTATLVSADDVEYVSDDDLLDGTGEIVSENVFTDTDVLDVSTTGEANIRMQLVEGEFHRVLNVFELDLTVDIRVERDPNGTPASGDEVLVCEADDVSLAVAFAVVPRMNDPTTVLEGEFSGSATRAG